MRANMSKNKKLMLILFWGCLFFLSGLGENSFSLWARGKQTSPKARLIQVEDQVLLDHLRVILKTTQPVTYRSSTLSGPDRLVIDLSPCILDKEHSFKIKDPRFEGLNFSQFNSKTVRIVFALSQPQMFHISTKEGKPFQLFIDFLNLRSRIFPSIPGKDKEGVLRPKTVAEFTGEKALREREVKKEITDAKKQRYKFDFYMENLHNVLRSISDIGESNILVGDDVKEKKVTLTLKDVTWQEALNAILDSVNLVKIDHGPNTYLVITAESYAKKLEEAKKNREAKRKEEQEELKNEEQRQKVGKVLYLTKNFQIKNVDVKVVEELIQGSLEREKKIASGQPGGPTVSQTEITKVIGTNANIISVPHTNTLIAKGSERDLDYIEGLVKAIDQPISQVMIEARIIEANANFTRDLGIRWGGTYPFANASGPYAGTIRGGISGTTADPTVSAVNLPFTTAVPAFGGLGLAFATTNFNIDARIQAMEQTGRGKTLSSPKVLTLDNKKAIIKQGQAIPVTTRTENNTFSTTYKDAALTLEVIPHILASGKKMRVEMKITKNEPDFIHTDSLGNPTINTKEASTEMVINDGNTVVLGGIIFKKEAYAENRVPGLADIPVLGWLFRTRYKHFEDTELIIFLTPQILKSSLKERFGEEN
jgi:type IV pilus assembly protein PilQ